MKNQPNRAVRGPRQVPLDHLRPGARPRDDAALEEPGHGTRPSTGGDRAEPAEPVTPGDADGDAVRGKATRSPAEIGTRRNLEGSEQGPM